MNSGLGKESTRKACYAALYAAAAVFLFGAGINNVGSYMGWSRAPVPPTPAGQSIPEVYASLERFAKPTESSKLVSRGKTDTALPDVETMIERLATRLATEPDDIKGWKMLGWSYFQVARYGEAAAAYARAMRIEPDSAEIKGLFDEAKANALKTVGSEGASAADKGNETKADHLARTEHTRSNDPEIRLMVDRLSDRLSRSPQDLEGWIQLMRSRIVLGDRHAAVKAMQDAVAVFKSDIAASDKIAGVAVELGLNLE